MRVAIVTPEGLAGRGGVGRVMTYLTRHLRAQFPDIDPSVHRTRFSEGAIMKHLTVLPALVLFVGQLIAQNIQVVHINVAPRGSTWRKMLYMRAATMLGRRTVLHLHGSGYDEFFAAQSPDRQRVIRDFFRDANVSVALSGYWKEFMIATLNVQPQKVWEIPNGVPDPPERLAQAHDETAPMIVCLGLVGHRKGTDVLLDALAALKADGIPFRAKIGGNGEVEAAIARAQTLQLGDQVEFLGWVDEADADRLLWEADVFVLPSRAENQPVSILEAMARGVPVVSTSVGAIPEQVVDGQTGFLVPPTDAVALKNALATLLQSKDLRTTFGQAGQRRFRERFSVATCASRFAELYRSLAS